MKPQNDTNATAADTKRTPRSKPITLARVTLSIQMGVDDKVCFRVTGKNLFSKTASKDYVQEMLVTAQHAIKCLASGKYDLKRSKS